MTEKRTSYCIDVKADWDKRKIQEDKTSKEQKQILKAQEQIKKEQSSLIKCQGNDYKQWKIIISEYTKELAGDSFEYEKIDSIMVKGKSEPITIYFPKNLTK